MSLVKKTVHGIELVSMSFLIFLFIHNEVCCLGAKL